MQLQRTAPTWYEVRHGDVIVVTRGTVVPAGSQNEEELIEPDAPLEAAQVSTLVAWIIKVSPPDAFPEVVEGNAVCAGVLVILTNLSA